MGDSTEDEILNALYFRTSAHHTKPKYNFDPWVFWSHDDEGSQHNSSSAGLGDRITYEKIKYAFSNVRHCKESIIQFWAPVIATTGNRLLLSASGQPFALGSLRRNLCDYRLRSLDYQYDIDVNKLDHMKIGAPATAFLNCYPEIVHVKLHQGQGSPLMFYASVYDMKTSYMLPICFPSQPSCIGVVECTLGRFSSDDCRMLAYMKMALKKVGLSVFDVQERIPYKTISGLKPARDEIHKALEIICGSHNIALAQVWIPYKDENHVPFSTSLVDTRTKQTLALKLTGYVVDEDDIRCIMKEYYDSCDIVSPKAGEELVATTLQDYEPRLCRCMYGLGDEMLMACTSVDGAKTHGFTICLRSIDTGDLDYAFEFIWLRNPNYAILLEALLKTLKKCLPGFKLASGADLGHELRIIDVKDFTNGLTKTFKIFQGKKSSQEEGNRPMLVEYIAPSGSKFKTTPILLPREVIELQFGNTMNEAAKNLNVSLSTLKRKCKDFGITEWRGPNVVKRKVNDSYNNQRNTNEEDNGAIQGSWVVNRNENTLTIKAVCADDMIKFHLDISQATFLTVEKEIGKKFKMTPGTYKLKYHDDDGDWILLTSDQDVNDCIKSSINLDGTVIRLRVLPSTQPICCPSGSYDTCST